MANRALVAAVAILAATSSGCQLQPAPAQTNPIERRDAASTPEVVAAVSPSVVRICFGEGDMISGTLISAEGLVLTCAHLPVAVGHGVEIGLSDGRFLPAKVLSKLPRDGESRACRDIALLKVDATGPFPFAQMAAASPVDSEERFLALGFPDTLLLGEDRRSDPLYVRIGEHIADPYQSCEDEFCTTVRGTGGDSGGPLFDRSGRVVGVVHGGDLSGAHVTYTRIEVVRRNWKMLAPAVDEPALPQPAGPRARLSTLLPAEASILRSSVVEVHSRSRLCALGTVVGSGLILTKASELGPSLTVVTPAGYVAIAEIAAADPDVDLALLRLPHAPEVLRGLPTVAWMRSEPVTPGTVVWSVGSSTVASQSGVVCFSPRSVPPIAGFIPCEFEQGDGGVRVVKVVDALRSFRLRPLPLPLRAGDTLLSVEGSKVASIADYKEVMFSGNRIGEHPPVAGETIKVTFRRGGDILEERLGLEFTQTPTGQLIRPASARYSGFATVVATDLTAYPEHCGGPVVNCEGALVGLLLARAPLVETLVIPADQVALSVEKMMSAIRDTAK